MGATGLEDEACVGGVDLGLAVDDEDLAELFGEVALEVGAPPYPAGTCDVVLARHVLWALPDPGAAIARWAGLLAPGGLLVLVEGHWHAGAGLPSAECTALVRGHRREASVTRLTDPALWGRAVDDERYLVVSRS